MTGSVAVAIAVARISDFPALPGSINGAKAFAEWATSQEFEKVVLVTDKEGPVKIADIYRIVNSAVHMGPRRLFIYFAGHGLARGFGEDLWLLTEAASNPSEAVDVAHSVRIARYSGIPHIAVFADTCRTVAEGPKLLAVTGSSIFPTPNYRVKPSELDQFYAAAPGQAAWERRPGDPSVPPYGIYSRCLFTALSGEDYRAVTKVDGGPTPEAVLSRGLRDYLSSVVPTVARQEAGRPQRPDSLAGSYWKPNVLAWIRPPNSLNRAVASSPSTDKVGRADSGRNTPDPADINLKPIPQEFFPAEDPAWNEEIDSTISDLESICRQSGGAGGVFISGTIVTEAEGATVHYRPGSYGGSTTIEPRPLQVFKDGNDCRILEWRDGPSPMHFRLSEQGPIATTTTFPGHTTVMRVSRGRVDQIIFVPISPKNHNIEQAISTLARAAVLGQSNLFDPDSAEWESMLFQELNPSIAIQAAYAWQRRGDREKIRDLARRFHASRRTIPFDLDFLAIGLAGLGRLLASSFPLMTSGWPAFIGPEPRRPLVNERLRPSTQIYGNRALLSKLLPTQWATFVSLDPEIRNLILR